VVCRVVCQSEWVKMRVLTVLAVSTALMPALVLADPAQPQTVPITGAQAAPTSATPSPGTAAPAAPSVSEHVIVHGDASNDSLDEIVCKTLPPQTGTRLGGSRECHTVRQWKEEQKQAQGVLAHNQSLGMQQPLRDHP
jgi:hypothetical protein